MHHKLVAILEQVMRYGAISLICTLIILFFLYFFTVFMRLHYVLSSLLAFTIATVYSYWASRTFAFHSRAKLLESEEKFLTVSAIAFFLNIACIYFFTDMLGIYYLYSQLISGFINFVVTFFIHKYWTFRAKPL